MAKAARLAGFPRASLRTLPTDARFRLVPEALEEAIREDRSRGRRPFLVVANVGHDEHRRRRSPARGRSRIAREHGLWVHADAAYGGFFRLAPGGEALLRGIEDCDSITLDPHKGLFLPYGLGALLVRDGAALARAHRGSASYVQDVTAEGSLGFADLSPELSRDFRGLRVWLPLMLHGVAAFREQLAREARPRPLGLRDAPGRPAVRDARRAAALGGGLPPARGRKTRPSASGPSCCAA